jgi:hypothetical protein
MQPTVYPTNIKNICLKVLYFSLHKNNKHLDLCMYISNVCIFQIYRFYQIFYFCISHNIKNFTIKFYITVNYIIDHVQIYFHKFLKLITMILSFLLKMEGALKHWSLGAKNTFPLVHHHLTSIHHELVIMYMLEIVKSIRAPRASPPL